ncbi:hypothetical protein GDO86_015879 [Hymenochirus boettgeri]|uniref:Uncharacterized protein n=1 Tax=Hymenochirus boettgeri TaxID=247094 RepID=A0A8T2K359_9PIPI|nr:hypothetical protein GDO86_015879 [Hymenochirus boettgeri]
MGIRALHPILLFKTIDIYFMHFHRLIMCTASLRHNCLNHKLVKHLSLYGVCSFSFTETGDVIKILKCFLYCLQLPTTVL